ncbi:MAG: transposase [Chloroflexota bacterium]|jgi:REP element-mobilizing transposase RayT
MSGRPRRPTYTAGHYYHFYNRGAHRLPIFREADNYLFILGRIKRYLRQLELTIIAYCLMPNHYHLLVRQEGQHAAGLLPQRVFNSYSKAYNKRYGHSGTLFEGHYEVVETASEAHLRHLCRYIHANPVKDGLVTELAAWPYSNYLEWVAKRKGTLVDRDFVAELFGSPDDYVEFLTDYLEGRAAAAADAAYLDRL